MMIVANRLKLTIEQLANAGVETPRLDAEVLLAHVLGVGRADLYCNLKRVLTDEEVDLFSSFVKRRVEKEPVAYITGVKEFWSLSIHVTPDVLIPRPETEGIVEQALKIYKKSPLPPFVKGGIGGILNCDPFSILDLCTGSGCVAAALATEFPNARIVATDISPAAIEVAKYNLTFARNRVEFFIGNLFEVFHKSTPLKKSSLSVIASETKQSRGIATAPSGPRNDFFRGFESLFTSHESPVTEKFDLITANPPYIANDDFETLSSDIRHYEPHLALIAGQDGLAISKQIIKDAPNYLKPGGVLIMEMGINQARELQKYAECIERYDEILVIKDYSGIERILVTRTISPPL
jgi:release factor glutamine methyltransferase